MIRVGPACVYSIDFTNVLSLPGKAGPCSLEHGPAWLFLGDLLCTILIVCCFINMFWQVAEDLHFIALVFLNHNQHGLAFIYISPS